MNRILITLFACALAACSTSKPPEAAAPSAQAPTAAPVPAAAAPAPAKSAPVAKQESPQEAFEQMRARLTRDSVFFDFDKYALRAESASVVEGHAKLLNSYSHGRLTLQGNCDERGSSEYNLALGQRRADAVKERLVMLGVQEGRIETISFGKEKPRETCHAEHCWAENRRADFVEAWR